MSHDDASERHHFKIGEVAELVGVRPHVLRYWEQEFPALRPKKTRGSHRHYSRDNVELARQIRALVVEEGYSLAGAKRRLAELRSAPAAQARPASTLPTQELIADLLGARADLVALLDRLDGEESEGDEGAHITEQAAEPAVVLVPTPATRRRGA